ncbi:MAG TPA: class I SAM-dependent methyltransferase [Bacillales bacterium]|nr:class I SAM-dependent methyltransferase [Bacillales bacterium]
METNDHFSIQAKQYSKYRPHYPKELYMYLLSCVKEKKRAWDCATGNGQAAVALSEYFDNVIGTDLSLSQLTHAIKKRNIEYYESVAESTPIASNSIDLITLAQALHWFDFNKFYKEVHRVGAHDSIIAAWCYGQCTISKPIDEITDYLYRDVLNGFWPNESKYIQEEYMTIPFPFKKIESPAFHMMEEWNLDEYIGYLNTWSATQKFITNAGTSLLSPIHNELKKAWGEPETHHKVTWPIHMLIGKIK